MQDFPTKAITKHLFCKRHFCNCNEIIAILQRFYKALNLFPIDNYIEFSEKAKQFASGFNPCVILDSCQISPQRDERKYKLVLGFGGAHIFEPKSDKLNELFKLWEKKPSWMFGVLGYNLKNEFENLESKNIEHFGWPDISFFIPETILTIDWNNQLTIYGNDPESVLNSILTCQFQSNTSSPLLINSELHCDFKKIEHENTIELIKEEIRNGNVYELNLCSGFVFNNSTMTDPYAVFKELTELSPTPFSAYLKLANKTVISASPERYLLKNHSHLVSQPIKGTRPRGQSVTDDQKFKEDLINNAKDRAENVMIVDLVRNDLAHVSVPGKVCVDELFGIYSYSHVHQMVSTISAQIEDKFVWSDAIRYSFPMGSMTGTPKISAMRWIEKFEISNREWYSGALGYIDPEGNFDFNVLIRSLFYDSEKQTLAYFAGGAITIDSDPEDEFNEMMIKAKAIQTILKKYSSL